MRTITTRSWMTLSSSLLGLDWGYTTLPLLVAVGLHVTLELAVFVQAFSYTLSPWFRLVELMNQSLLFISSCIHYRVIHFWLPLDQLSLPCLFPSLFFPLSLFAGSYVSFLGRYFDTSIISLYINVSMYINEYETVALSFFPTDVSSASTTIKWSTDSPFFSVPFYRLIEVL